MNIKDMTNEEVLKTFINFLEDRVSITTGFVGGGEEDTNLTHQFLRIVCGDMEVVSHPEPLAAPLRIATANELGMTVN